MVILWVPSQPSDSAGHVPTHMTMHTNSPESSCPAAQTPAHSQGPQMENLGDPHLTLLPLSLTSMANGHSVYKK